MENTLEAPKITNMIPATKLRQHKKWYPFPEEESVSSTDKKVITAGLQGIGDVS